MPLRDEHISQAQGNEEFYKGITTDRGLSRFTDWAVTSLFYISVHYVDAYLDQSLKAHPKAHDKRQFWVDNTPQLKPIASKYRQLHNRSRDARYEIVAFSPADVQTIERDLSVPVNTHLKGLLGIL